MVLSSTNIVQMGNDMNIETEPKPKRNPNWPNVWPFPQINGEKFIPKNDVKVKKFKPVIEKPIYEPAPF